MTLLTGQKPIRIFAREPEIRRRRILAAAGVLLAAPQLAYAQRATKIFRIGVLIPTTPAAAATVIKAFEQGLREHGYVPGRNIVVTYRYSDGLDERISHLAAELVHAEPDVILTTTDSVVRIVKQHTQAISIVMVNTSDPVGAGLVKALAHPGANITGLTNFSPEISGKRLQLLKEFVPDLSRVAYLWNPDLAGATDVYREVVTAARRLGMAVQSVEVHRAEDIDSAFSVIAKRGSIGLLVQAPNPVLYSNRKQITGLANLWRLPSMFNRMEYVSDGGLMSYGPNVPDMYRRAAAYMDKIFKGAKPGDLPVEQPTRFDLVINLKTAKALNLAIPQLLLLRADQVIE
jgi:putative ABC transport system substrate-binding protein